MIIFPDQKKIILHVPKTGGTFIKNLLDMQKQSGAIILSGKIFYKKNIYDLSHLTLGESVKFNLLSKNFSKYKVYLFSRNVVSRINSSINECLRQNLLGLNKKGFYNKKEIDNCLDILIRKVKKNFKNNWVNYEYSLTHFKPQQMYNTEKCKIIPNEILFEKKKLINFFNKEFNIKIKNSFNFDQVNRYSSAIPYSNNKLINLYFNTFNKGNYLKYRFLNYSLKKKINFNNLFEEKFRKLTSYYIKDKNL